MEGMLLGSVDTPLRHVREPYLKEYVSLMSGDFAGTKVTELTIEAAM